jgi:hypothetical protein
MEFSPRLTACGATARRGGDRTGGTAQAPREPASESQTSLPSRPCPPSGVNAGVPVIGPPGGVAKPCPWRDLTQRVSERLVSDRLDSERDSTEAVRLKRLDSELAETRGGEKRPGELKVDSERLSSEGLDSERLDSERLGETRLGETRRDSTRRDSTSSTR